MAIKKTMWIIFLLTVETEVFVVEADLPNSEDASANALPDPETTAATLPPLGPSLGITYSRFDPYFDSTTPRNVTGLVGKSAYLSCRVRNLGNKTVSWIRHRDIHILTVGTYTYTSDQRFQSIHHDDTDDWTLKVKWAQKRDGGIYECQVSTQPVRSYFINLIIVDSLPDDVQADYGDIYHQMQSDRGL